MASTERSVAHCEKCGFEMGGEMAHIEERDEIWCHSCADNAAEAAYERMCEDFHDGGSTAPWPDVVRQRQIEAQKLK